MFSRTSARVARRTMIAAVTAVLFAACSSSGSDADTVETTFAPVVETSAAPVIETTAAPSVETTAAASAAARPEVVVTYSVLGAAVEEIVGDAANVKVIIPNGQDPHDYAPSAKDIEAIRGATLVIANGGGLEEGLADALKEASSRQNNVFYALDHITTQALDAKQDSHSDEEEGEEEGHSDEEEGEEEGHSDEKEGAEEEGHSDEKEGAEEEGHSDDEHGSVDPHVWTSPLAMAEMSPALVKELGTRAGIDLTANGAAAVAAFEAIDAEVKTAMAQIPTGMCKLVTGHESLAYFADRYGCVVKGTVVASLSSSAEPSAKDLATLKDAIKEAGVPVIFSELGTNPAVAEQIAKETGASVVELTTHAVPADRTYRGFMLGLAETIVTGLNRPT
jgi:zinc/manganese transport system substrate-binding protein